jgi:hypothetical protein
MISVAATKALFFTWPARKPNAAEVSADNDEEHAVSMVMLGPLKPKEKEIRFDAMPPATPVPEYTLYFGGAYICQS